MNARDEGQEPVTRAGEPGLARETGVVAAVARELAAAGIAHEARWEDPQFAPAGEGQVQLTGVPGWSCRLNLSDQGYALLECNPAAEARSGRQTIVTVTTWAVRIIARDPSAAWQPPGAFCGSSHRALVMAAGVTCETNG